MPAVAGEPAVVGMSAMDAVYLLRKMGYNPRLRGAGNVIGQSIPAGSPATAGTEVVLELGLRRSPSCTPGERTSDGANPEG